MSHTTLRRGDWRARDHAGWWAFAIHRVSGLALSLFLPVHFWVLSHALLGEASLGEVLRWTEQPLVKASEVALVFLLAVHLAGGLRLLVTEFVAWRAAWQPTLIAVVAGMALLCALTFALNLAS